MIYAILSVLFLAGVGWVGGALGNLNLLFAVVIPYVALAAFVFGFCLPDYRVGALARSLLHPHDLRTAAVPSMDQTR